MPDFLPRLVALMDARLSDPALSVEALADDLAMTSRHLRRLLVARTGETPSARLRRRRVEHAETLLASGATLRAAARGAGYTDLSAFRRAFRVVTGHMPATLHASRHEACSRPMVGSSPARPSDPSGDRAAVSAAA